MIRHAAHKWHNSSLLSFLLISLSIFSQIFVYALQLQNYSSLTVCKSYQQITKVAISEESIQIMACIQRGFGKLTQKLGMAEIILIVPLNHKISSPKVWFFSFIYSE